MTQPLFWLTLTAVAAASMWVPYILNSFVVRGPMGTMLNPTADAKPLAAWAQRARQAHCNAIENLGAFAVLVIVAHLVGLPPEAIGTSAMLYFYIRLAHFVIYTLGIPVARTVTFLLGFGIQIYIAVQILTHL